MKPWQFILILSGLLIAGLFLLLIFLGYILNIPGKHPATPPRETTAALTSEVPAPGVPAFTRGPTDASMTVVAYIDFTCAHCKTMNGHMNRLLAEYPTTLRVLWKDLFSATNNTAERVHIAARCAGEQEKFWEFRDGAFALQPNFTAQRLRVLASSVGLNVPQFSTCIERSDHRQLFDTVRAEARTQGITATPTLLLNEDRIAGLVDYSTLQQWIEQQSKK